MARDILATVENMDHERLKFFQFLYIACGVDLLKLISETTKKILRQIPVKTVKLL